ncbi:MAG: D-alanine--D-alanine ligase [Deltaproteobacteria bacterium]|nr:D-alanine--D-alanine ligase [Deltaproteobacteria bacterium]
MARLTVAVLMGGASGEHDVSLSSGQGILANLDPGCYVSLPVVIGRDGAWSVAGAAPVPLWEGLAVVARAAALVFPALHGPNGEDGTVQGLLELAGIPFVGSDHYASALAMDKPRAKDVYRAAGIDTPAYVEVSRRAFEAAPDAVLEPIAESLGLPCVVKTPRLGSSVGVAIARDRDALAATLADILPLAGRAMVERFVRGTELTAPVLEDPDSGLPEALPLVEIRPRVSGWFDFRAKYEKGGSEELCPAPVPPALTLRVQELGLAAHRALGCRGMSRTDVLVDAAGTPWVIETNTLPGFTPTSLLPQAAAAAGISYPALVDRLIRRALRG